MSSMVKRQRGAPRKGEQVRVRVTRSFSPELLAALDAITDNQSDFIEDWMWNNPKIKLLKSLEAFIASPDFKDAVESATIASWKGDEVRVEILPDGSWRKIYYSHGEFAQMKYEFPGAILFMPALDCAEMPAFIGQGGTEQEWFDLAFANERDEIEQELRKELKHG